MKKLLLSGMILFSIGLSGMASIPVDSVKTSKVQVKLSADLVSSYVWRGVKSTNTPNIQPTLALTYGNVELGSWGSTDFSGNYKELDLYASYTLGVMQFALTDYNWNFIRPYFAYRHNCTDHIGEVSVTYSGTKSFPLSINFNTMIYGADKKIADQSKNAYSSYVELKYPVLSSVNLFVGITPGDGYYGDSYGKAGGVAVVNAGIVGTRSVQVSQTCSIPLKVTVGINPQKEDVYMVLGITF